MYFWPVHSAFCSFFPCSSEKTKLSPLLSPLHCLLSFLYLLEIQWFRSHVFIYFMSFENLNVLYWGDVDVWYVRFFSGPWKCRKIECHHRFTYLFTTFYSCCGVTVWLLSTQKNRCFLQIWAVSIISWGTEFYYLSCHSFLPRKTLWPVVDIIVQAMGRRFKEWNHAECRKMWPPELKHWQSAHTSESWTD